MPRKPNYDFERRQKEQARKTKKEAKRAERQQRRDERRGDETGEDAPADSTSGEEGTTPDAANEGGGNA